MTYRNMLLTALPITLSIASSAYANSLDPDLVTQIVGGSLTNTNVDSEFGAIAIYLAQSALPFLNVIAGVTIVVAGILAVIAQDENRINNTRNVVVSAIVAIILVNTAGAIAEALWGEFGYLDGGGPGGGQDVLSDEVLGLIDWIEEPIVIFAILTIVISGIRTITKFGSEDGLASLRNTIASVIFGLIIIVVKFVVSDVVINERTATRLNDIGIDITSSVLLYMGLFAVASIVIAGLYMVANIGNEEQYTKAKNLLVRVIVGLVVIALASTLAVLLVDNLIT